MNVFVTCQSALAVEGSRYFLMIWRHASLSAGAMPLAEMVWLFMGPNFNRSGVVPVPELGKTDDMTDSHVRSQQWQEASHCVLYDADAMAQPRAELFDPGYWYGAGRVEGSAMGRSGRAVTFVRGGANDEVWALRHYRRGGWAGRVIEDSYLWLGLDAARPFREFRLTAELHAKGLPVPKPVAAHVERSGPIYRGDLITQRIDGAEPLADLLLAEPMPPLQWIVLGRVLRRFHQAGVRHDDINARNILRDARGSFHMIDFDKAELLPSGGWQAQNFARFRRSLDKFKAADSRFHFEAVDWQALRTGYST